MTASGVRNAKRNVAHATICRREAGDRRREPDFYCSRLTTSDSRLKECGACHILKKPLRNLAEQAEMAKQPDRTKNVADTFVRAAPLFLSWERAKIASSAHPVPFHLITSDTDGPF